MAALSLSVATVALFPVPSRAAATREAELTAAEGTAGGSFGVSVSISGDTAVVGAPNEGGMGAAYVFTRSAGTWTERATLVAPVPVEGGKFGYEVAIDGDTVVVGAPDIDQDPAGPGAAHVFVRSEDTWPLQKTLTASDAADGDAFGTDVAVSGDTVVAGAPTDDVGASSDDQGSAYVFTRSGDVWSEQKLTARDGAGGDQFGGSVDISGDTVVVGAWGHDVGLGIDQGSAHVFTRNGSTWTEQAKLTATDGLTQDSFGSSVAIGHDMIVVGATVDDLSGTAYVFERHRGSWMQQAKLTPPDGFPADQFGRSVAVARHTVVVGAHFHDDDPLDRVGGRVYVFDRVADGWSEPTKLTEPGAGIFGNSVGISGHTIIVGAGFTKVGENDNQGKALVYRWRSPKHAATTGGDGAHGRPLPASILPETR